MYTVFIIMDSIIKHKCEHCNFNRCKFYEDYYWQAHDGICAEEGFINFKEKVD